jgi:hypothetical protein
MSAQTTNHAIIIKPLEQEYKTCQLDSFETNFLFQILEPQINLRTMLKK